jgi:fructose 1,6-bisphosphatase
MADLTDRHLQYKEEIARTILSVADKILPGQFQLPIFQFFVSPVALGLRNMDLAPFRQPEDVFTFFVL